MYLCDFLSSGEYLYEMRQSGGADAYALCTPMQKYSVLFAPFSGTVKLCRGDKGRKIEPVEEQKRQQTAFDTNAEFYYSIFSDDGSKVFCCAWSMAFTDFLKKPGEKVTKGEPIILLDSYLRFPYNDSNTQLDRLHISWQRGQFFKMVMFKNFNTSAEYAPDDFFAAFPRINVKGAKIPIQILGNNIFNTKVPVFFNWCDGGQECVLYDRGTKIDLTTKKAGEYYKMVKYRKGGRTYETSYAEQIGWTDRILPGGNMAQKILNSITADRPRHVYCIRKYEKPVTHIVEPFIVKIKHADLGGIIYGNYGQFYSIKPFEVIDEKNGNDWINTEVCPYPDWEEYATSFEGSIYAGEFSRHFGYVCFDTIEKDEYTGGQKHFATHNLLANALNIPVQAEYQRLDLVYSAFINKKFDYETEFKKQSIFYLLDITKQKFLFKTKKYDTVQYNEIVYPGFKNCFYVSGTPDSIIGYRSDDFIRYKSQANTFDLISKAENVFLQTPQVFSFLIMTSADIDRKGNNNLPIILYSMNTNKIFLDKNVYSGI